jgi:hypothetical protein
VRSAARELGRGVGERFIAEVEKAILRSATWLGYMERLKEARKNFAEFHNLFLIQRSVPLTRSLRPRRIRRRCATFI